MIKLETNIKEFQKNLDKFLQKTKQNKEKILAELAFKFKRMVKLRNPVDLGQSRAGWYIRPLSEGGWSVYNRVHYTVYLEFGHSKQAPLGMVRVSLKELSRKVLKLK